MTDFAMFLAATAAPNLDPAIENGVWGWTDTVLDSPGQNHHGTTGRERVAALRPGDRLLIATGQRGASVTRRYDPNRRVVLARLIECKITEPLYIDSSSVWEPAPDGYLNRVRFDAVSETNEVEATQAGADLMLALTDSINRSGTPFPVKGTNQLAKPGERPLFVSPPPRSTAVTVPSGRTNVVGPSHDYEADATRRRAIGELGEEFVVRTERDRLRAAQRTDLADRVEHVAKTIGDGLGFDVLSFDESSGDELHIEVKSTVGSKTEPFPITAAEVRYSTAAGDKYRLYRVFSVESHPQVFVLSGDLQQHFNLTATAYMASR